MSLRIEDLLFSPLPDESEEAHAERVRQLSTMVERVLDTEDGHALVNMLLDVRNPLLSRFGTGRTVEEAAFVDGQADVIGFFVRHVTGLGISK